MIILLISSVLGRMDGWGRGDNFLPFIKWPKWGGINYSRCAIGILPAILFKNPWFILTYIIAGLVPYSEKCWLSKYPFTRTFNWAVYGFLWGLAALSWGNAALGMALFVFLMSWSNYGIVKNGHKLDHAWLEFIYYGVMMGVFLWK